MSNELDRIERDEARQAAILPMRTFVIAWQGVADQIPNCECVQAVSLPAALRNLRIGAEEAHKVFEVTGSVVLVRVPRFPTLKELESL